MFRFVIYTCIKQNNVIRILTCENEPIIPCFNDNYKIDFIENKKKI